jgi:hypothetical protein
MLTTITAITGLVFGLIGAILGIFNTIQQFRKDKVRLKLVPKIYRHEANGGHLCSARIPTENEKAWHGMCLEIINLSVFAVTIDEIGLLSSDEDSRIVFPTAELSNNESLPKRLEPRASVTCYIPSNSPATILNEGLPFAKGFYATTSCGVTATGKSAISKWLIKIGKKYNQPRK